MRTQADRDFDLASGRELERKDAEIDRLRAALETSGRADIYRDGFDAAVEIVEGYEVHIGHGPTDAALRAAKSGILLVLQQTRTSMRAVSEQSADQRRGQ